MDAKPDRLDLTTPPASEDSAPSADEPTRIDLGTRSFGGTNVAADQRDQARERGEGLGAGSSGNYAARHEAEDREQPEDDLD